MDVDRERLTVSDPTTVLRGVLTDTAEGHAEYDVSSDGTLVYLSGDTETEDWLVRLVPGLPAERLNTRPLDLDYLTLDLSPDGRLAALVDPTGDVLVVDVERGELIRNVTRSPAVDFYPVWEPDSLHLAHIVIEAGWQIVRTSIDGTGDPETLLPLNDLRKYPMSWSPDGSVLAVQQMGESGDLDIWTVPRGRSEQARPFLHTSASETDAAFSLDGRWLAYVSDNTGRPEVYVTSYPDGEVNRLVSRSGGRTPRWSLDGRLFFATGDRVSMVEQVEPAPSEPVEFVRGVDTYRSWDVMPDGSAVIALEKRQSPRLIVVQNWLQELDRLAPLD